MVRNFAAFSIVATEVSSAILSSAISNSSGFVVGVAEAELDKTGAQDRRHGCACERAMRTRSVWPPSFLPWLQCREVSTFGISRHKIHLGILSRCHDQDRSR